MKLSFSHPAVTSSRLSREISINFQLLLVCFALWIEIFLVFKDFICYVPQKNGIFFSEKLHCDGRNRWFNLEACKTHGTLSPHEAVRLAKALGWPNKLPTTETINDHPTITCSVHFGYLQHYIKSLGLSIDNLNQHNPASRSTTPHNLFSELVLSVHEDSREENGKIGFHIFSDETKKWDLVTLVKLPEGFGFRWVDESKIKWYSPSWLECRGDNSRPESSCTPCYRWTLSRIEPHLKRVKDFLRSNEYFELALSYFTISRCSHELVQHLPHLLLSGHVCEEFSTILSLFYCWLIS